MLGKMHVRSNAVIACPPSSQELDSFAPPQSDPPAVVTRRGPAPSNQPCPPEVLSPIPRKTSPQCAGRLALPPSAVIRRDDRRTSDFPWYGRDILSLPD